MGPTVITSKKESACPLCPKGIKIGERIAQKDGKWAHADCIWPKGAKGQAAGPEDREPVHKVTAEEHAKAQQRLKELKAKIDADVTENLDFAINLVKSRLAENPHLERSMTGAIPEIMHERYGTASQFRIHRLQAQDR